MLYGRPNFLEFQCKKDQGAQRRLVMIHRLVKFLPQCVFLSHLFELPSTVNVTGETLVQNKILPNLMLQKF